jgi:tripeptide aminopeptidase
VDGKAAAFLDTLQGGPEPDAAQAVDLVMQLMAIPGGSGQEKDVATFVVERLKAAGCPEAWIAFDRANEKTPSGGNVGNLIVKFPGTDRGPRRLLMAHMDTVPVCLGSKPVRKKVAGKRIVTSSDPTTGLGADDRSGVAVVLATAIEILSAKLPHPPLTFFFAIQEEVGLWGARLVSAASLGKPKLAFNFDGGDAEKLTVGATGGYRLDIEVEGIPSHAGVAPEKGVSAIAIASLAIASLVDEGWHGLVTKGGKRGTSNVGVIQAGNATNVVAERATLRAEARGHDRVFRERIVRAIEKAFRDAARRVKATDGRSGSVVVSGHLDYEAFRLDEQEPCVIAAQRAVEAIGLTPRLDVSNGGLDANWMAAHGVPTVTLGCGQHDIHTTDEWLDVDAFEQACRIALRLATGA